MTSPMSREDGDRFRARWEALARKEREELLAMTPEEKFRQTAALFASAQAFGWSEALAAEEEAVRARWMRIREALRER
ncbi:MAG: hypothetical protein IT364_01355 [Candidatus Hydrogenedentes bacterium]|nr:hypothetical protein [Candidatus Hydrogenedentota bacterium]